MKKEIITGMIGAELVEAHIYPGKDSGLSFYYFKGKPYIGFAAFTKIIGKIIKAH